MIDTNLNLEVAPVSPTDLTYDEAMLYCFTLEIDGKIGWRMPTHYEYNAFRCSLTGVSVVKYFCWFVDRVGGLTPARRVYPVRDLKYD